MERIIKVDPSESINIFVQRFANYNYYSIILPYLIQHHSRYTLVPSHLSHLSQLVENITLNHLFELANFDGCTIKLTDCCYNDLFTVLPHLTDFIYCYNSIDDTDSFFSTHKDITYDGAHGFFCSHINASTTTIQLLRERYNVHVLDGNEAYLQAYPVWLKENV